MQRNKTVRYLYVLCICTGIAFLLFAYTTELLTDQYYSNKSSSIAVVTQVLTDYAEDYGKVVYVRYTDGQEEYESKLNIDNRKYSIGDEVTVYFNPGKPYLIYLRRSTYYYLWVVLGIIFTVIGITGCFFLLDRNRKVKWLKVHGISIEAVVTDITLDFSANIKWTYPYVIICEQEDETNQTNYSFKSDYIWKFPEEVKLGDKVTVLVHPKDYRKYYVNLPMLYKKYKQEKQDSYAKEMRLNS